MDQGALTVFIKPLVHQEEIFEDPRIAYEWFPLFVQLARKASVFDRGIFELICRFFKPLNQRYHR